MPGPDAARPAKCADIPDTLFMAAVEATAPMNPGGCWRYRGDVQAELERMLGAGLPEKLFLAKARKLGAKQRLEGCTRCTCRGDYHLPRECRAYGCCYGAGFDWRTHPAYSSDWEDDRLPQRDPGEFRRYMEWLWRLGQSVAASSPGLGGYSLSGSAVLIPGL